MTDFPALLPADDGLPARPLVTVAADALDAWRAALTPRARVAAEAQGFLAKPGQLAILPGEAADDWSAALGVPVAADPWTLAPAAAKLPGGRYRLAGADGAAIADPGEAALGWLLAQHRFDRYRSAPETTAPRLLVMPDRAAAARAAALAEATALIRDMVDTPAADMGPAELVDAVAALAARHGGAIEVVAGDTLATGFPLIHAVGRAAAAHRQPRLIRLRRGDPGLPRLAIVGKGVCFDSGGLDIKPASGMLLMKKDMGGAAHAIALAGLVAAADLPVHLDLIVPAAENAISSDAFRPGDVLTARGGRTVEIGNTDAEGRLLLADALTLACEGDTAPDLLIDFATLTGAARVALGPDLPALFANDEGLATDFAAAAARASDPLWRLPLWAPYAELLASDLADVNNAGQSGFAGAITAALFLERFVRAGVRWAHLDTFAWMPAARPGRPKGGEALGLRAAFALIEARFAPR